MNIPEFLVVINRIISSSFAKIHFRKSFWLIIISFSVYCRTVNHCQNNFPDMGLALVNLHSHVVGIFLNGCHTFEPYLSWSFTNRKCSIYCFNSCVWNHLVIGNYLMIYIWILTWIHSQSCFQLGQRIHPCKTKSYLVLLSSSHAIV